MKIFKKKKEKELSPFIVKLLMFINRKLVQGSTHLQKKTEKYSKNKKKVFLMLFCFVFVSESTLIVINSFQKNNIALYTIAPIKIPRLTNGQNINPELTNGEFKRIEQFRHYLDSNVIFRDSVLTSRPHLIDTLNYLQQIYKQNENGK
ncbi:MAG: hypothetical protein M3R72_11870 [Bacteroidota bacterium]|nr:hypothetical protein [Bacteroidota bacterium]